jgi:hypothetical protein
VFRRQTRRKFTEALRQRIDLAGLHADAVDLLPDEIDGKPTLPVAAFARLRSTNCSPRVERLVPAPRPAASRIHDRPGDMHIM